VERHIDEMIVFTKRRHVPISRNPHERNVYSFDTVDGTALVYFKTAIIRCYVALFNRTVKKLPVTPVTTPWVVVVKCSASTSWHSGPLVSTVTLMTMMMMMTMMRRIMIMMMMIIIIINKTSITK